MKDKDRDFFHATKSRRHFCGYEFLLILLKLIVTKITREVQLFRPHLYSFVILNKHFQKIAADDPVPTSTLKSRERS